VQVAPGAIRMARRLAEMEIPPRTGPARTDRRLDGGATESPGPRILFESGAQAAPGPRRRRPQAMRKRPRTGICPAPPAQAHYLIAGTRKERSCTGRSSRLNDNGREHLVLVTLAAALTATGIEPLLRVATVGVHRLPPWPRCTAALRRTPRLTIDGPKRERWEPPRKMRPARLGASVPRPRCRSPSR
jgi:hypothetical protein